MYSVVLGLLDALLELKESIKQEARLERPCILFPYKSLKSEIALTFKHLLL